MLRDAAEAQLKLADEADSSPDPVDDVRLSHELQVHQIELQLRTEELERTRDEAEALAREYSDLYQAAPIGYVTLNPAGRITRVNLKARKILQLVTDQIVDRLLASFVAVEDLPAFDHLLSQLQEQGHAPVSQIKLNIEGDEPRILLVEGSGNQQGDDIRLCLLDITEHFKVETNARLAANVFEHTHEGIFITDLAGTILSVNDAFLKMSGFERAELVGQNARVLQSGRESAATFNDMWRSLEHEGYWVGEVWNRRKNGEAYAEQMTISAVMENNSPISYVALCADITAAKVHEKDLQHAIQHDPLTDLPNRLLLSDRLAQAIGLCQRRNRSLAVAYIDIDRFKEINDLHGHQIGDELLLQAAARMKGALRAGDTLARIGGDEFVCILNDISVIDECNAVLDRLLRAAARPYAIQNRTLDITVSIGVTLYPQDSADADTLLRHADIAMLSAKEGGKARYVWFDTSTEASLQLRREMQASIRAALKNDELLLFYQPKVNMNTGKLIGAEALIRWQHPVNGLMVPAAFLPFTENDDLEWELGNWVLNAALSQMSAWRKEGLGIQVSVNVTASQLQRPGFHLQLRDILRAFPAVPNASLEIEVLESSVLGDLQQTAEVITLCLSLGVNFALDDFGTGYSSLTYLRHLPAGLIKIDQSFVQGMLDDPADMNIVKSVIGMGFAFNRQVIAEGVESVALGQALLELGCLLGQGYEIAKPMPPAEFTDWITTWSPNTAWINARLPIQLETAGSKN